MDTEQLKALRELRKKRRAGQAKPKAAIKATRKVKHGRKKRKA